MQENEIKANFAKNIRDLRISKKMNQSQFGEKISYSSKAVSKWENGDVLPDITTLKMLADFFDITVDDLISNKNAVHESHRRLNHFLISVVSSALPYFVAAIAFLILTLVGFEKAWLSYIVAIPVSGIVLVVFASIWYKRIHVKFSTMYLVAGVGLATILILNFNYWWIILIITLILLALAFIFFSIRFHDKRKKIGQ